MAVPRFGRSTSEKSEKLKLADDLAARSRIIRKEAESEGAILDRLRRLGEEFASANAVRDNYARKTYEDEQAAKIQPLLDRAHEYLEDGDKARAEAKRTLDAFKGIDWTAIEEALSSEHGLVLRQTIETTNEEGEAVIQAAPEQFSTMNTKQRVAMLRAAIEDLREYVNASDSELRAVLRTMDFTPPSYPPDVQGPDGFPKATLRVNGRLRSAHAQFAYSMNALLRVLSYGPSAESIYGKLAGIKKLLSEIGADVLPISAEETK
jgi:hypothetical protein